MKTRWIAAAIATIVSAFTGQSWAMEPIVPAEPLPQVLEVAPDQIPVAWRNVPAWQPPSTLVSRLPDAVQLERVSYSDMARGEPQQAPDAYDSACDVCCVPPWIHRTGLFGEVLYLRARDAEVAYVVPVNGAIVPPPGVAPIQVGPVGVVDPDYTTAFRVGGTWACDECSSVVFTYTRFDTTTTDAQTIDAPLVLRPLVLHPGTANAGSDFLDANARLGIDLNLGDVDFRAVWDAGDLWVINYLVGARYARLNQDFDATFDSTGTVDRLLTNLNFDGGGIRVGLDGERHSGCGAFIYGKATASFVGGEFRGRYQQSSDVDPAIVDTSWKAGRLVSILDLELGAGWQSPCGHWRLTAGYVVSSWFNTVTTDQWIQAVQQNSFTNLGGTMTFDGLVGRVEYRF